MHHVSELLVPGFGTLSCCTRWLRTISPTEIWVWLLRNSVFRVCGVRQNLYVCSLYRKPDLDDRIFYWLLASMATLKAEDVRASFLFVGDLNGHLQECLVLRPRTVMVRHGSWLLNCLRLRSVGCWPNPCAWWNTWPPDDCCSWLNMVAVVAPVEIGSL